MTVALTLVLLLVLFTSGRHEALNGLLLIAWSASFFYLAMGQLWPWEHCAETLARQRGEHDLRDSLK